MVEAYSGDSKGGRAWARRIRQQVRDGPRGAARVLQAAAWQRNQRAPTGKRAQAYEKAHGYLPRQGRFKDYARSPPRGPPVGSAVSPAAPHTVFTPSFKPPGPPPSPPGRPGSPPPPLPPCSRP